jgi:hypothetical protein
MEKFDPALVSVRSTPAVAIRKNQVVLNTHLVNLLETDSINLYCAEGNLIIKPEKNGIPIRPNKKGECLFTSSNLLNWLQKHGFTKGKYRVAKTEDGFIATA